MNFKSTEFKLSEPLFVFEVGPLRTAVMRQRKTAGPITARLHTHCLELSDRRGVFLVFN